MSLTTDTIAAMINAFAKKEPTQTATNGDILAVLRELSAVASEGAGTGTVTSVSGGATGLTFATATTAPVMQGTLAVANGGTGLTAMGAANTVMGVNSGGTALGYKTLGTGFTVAGIGGSNIRVNLSTGVAGGQSVIGGIGPGENLILSSTDDPVKGLVLIGESQIDETTGNMTLAGSITTAAPAGHTAAAWNLGNEDSGVSTSGIEPNKVVWVETPAGVVPLAIATLL